VRTEDACLASTGALAPEPPRATGLGPEPPRIVGCSNPFFPPFSLRSDVSDIQFQIGQFGLINFVLSQNEEMFDFNKRGKWGEKGKMRKNQGLATIRGNSGPTSVARGWL